jgi:GntR family transcriptional regulator
MKVQIADDIRMKIERGTLKPGDELPTLNELVAEWDCSITTAREAIDLLKEQALITGGRGKPPVVRLPHKRIVRDASRHQTEKDLVLQPEEVRRGHGEAEDDLGDSIRNVRFHTDYTIIPADRDLASVFDIPVGAELLRKTYETSSRAGIRLAYSTGYVPVSLIEYNPILLTADCEPWPGGAQHQFHTVGIEIARVEDQVTAFMPTTVDIQRWKLDKGVPMLKVRRISIDTKSRVVEISDAQYPADRTELHFTTNLKLWEN